MKRGGPLRRGKPLKRGGWLTRKKPMRRVSAKEQKRRETTLPALREALIVRSRGVCEVRFSVHCSGVGVEPHHVRKRSQERHDDPAACLWSCRACNTAVEFEPLRARAVGVSALSMEEARAHVVARVGANA